VTGSAKRIGRAIALELARKGARIAVHYRASAREAQEVAGAAGRAFQADLTNVRAVEQMFNDIEKQFGGLDILVNNASVFSPATAQDSTGEDWDLQMETNAKASFIVAQRAARIMLKSHAGKIVNMVDVAGEVIWPGYFPYSVSKAALIAVNRGLAKAYA